MESKFVGDSLMKSIYRSILSQKDLRNPLCPFQKISRKYFVKNQRLDFLDKNKKESQIM